MPDPPLAGEPVATALLPPSGTQYRLAAGDLLATVTEVGGGLRELTHSGEPLVWGYRQSAMASGGRGQVLAPWPNRLEAGTYSFGGRQGKVPLDEPAKGNAIHGLCRWGRWEPAEVTSATVKLSFVLVPQPAYPWRIRLSIRYELSSEGLSVSPEVANLSEEAAPFGMGFHPYLHAGPGGVDACSLEVAAKRHLLMDERGLPCGEEPAGSDWDLSSPKPLAGAVLDDCLTGLGGGGDRWRAVLGRGDGRRTELWADSRWPYVMCFTGDSLPEADRRKGVAVEPMTCPPNALRTGTSLIAIEPGSVWSGTWGIRPLT